MKRFTYIFATIALIFTTIQCTQINSDESTLTVTIDKKEIKIKNNGPETINYTVNNASGNINVTFQTEITDVLIENTFSQIENKGTITFSTESENKAHYETDLVFKDDKSEYKTPFIIDISSVWTVVPGDPEE